MYQKDAAKMAGYSSAGFFTYGTHSERRAARAWIAFVPRGANPDGYRRRAKQDKASTAARIPHSQVFPCGRGRYGQAGRQSLTRSELGESRGRSLALQRSWGRPEGPTRCAAALRGVAACAPALQCSLASQRAVGRSEGQAYRPP